MLRPATFLILALIFAIDLSAKPVDYLTEIKPILAETCYRCHGAAQQKGGLRLDTAVFALKGGKTGPSFQPAKSEASLLVQVLKGTHPDIARMPYKKPALSDAQISLIERWIDEGATAPRDEAAEASKHWAFVRPARVSPPAIKST